jgi:hypothetical protein
MFKIDHARAHTQKKILLFSKFRKVFYTIFREKLVARIPNLEVLNKIIWSIYAVFVSTQHFILSHQLFCNAPSASQVPAHVFLLDYTPLGQLREGVKGYHLEGHLVELTQHVP